MFQSVIEEVSCCTGGALSGFSFMFLWTTGLRDATGHATFNVAHSSRVGKIDVFLSHQSHFNRV